MSKDVASEESSYMADWSEDMLLSMSSYARRLASFSAEGREGDINPRIKNSGCESIRCGAR